MALGRGLALTLLALGLAAAGANAAELVVEWAPLAIEVESYQVERRIDAAGEGFKPIARVGGAETRFIDRNVTTGTRYCYRVRGVRGVRVSPSSPPLCNLATEATGAVGKGVPPEGAPVAEPAAAAVLPAPAAEPAVAVVDPAPAPELAPAVSARAAPALVLARAAEPAAPALRGEDREVKALRRPPPAYPPGAQLQGISGWVKLSFTVTAQGTTRDVRVAASDPPGVFDAAAVEAAERFVYAPRLENGVAVDRPNVETEITFTWIDRGGILTTDGRPPTRR